MQNYHTNDPFQETEHLDPDIRYNTPSNYRPYPPQSYSPSQTPYYDAYPAPSPSLSHHPSSHPDSAWMRNREQQQMQDHHSYHSNSSHPGPGGYDSPQRRPSPNPPSRGNDGYYNTRGGPGGGGGGGGGYPGYAPLPPNAITPGTDNFNESASGGMAGIAYSVADRNPRNSGMDAMHSAGQVPPPPSRSQYPPQPPPHGAYSPQSSGYGYDDAYAMGGDSHSTLAGLGPGAAPPGSRSPSHHGNIGNVPNDAYQGLSGLNNASHLGVVNPNDIEDDGDDGLVYGRSQRNSILSLPHSERGRRAAAPAAGAGGGVVAGALVTEGIACSGVNKRHGIPNFDQAHEKPSEWLQKNQSSSRKGKWAIIIIVILVIVGAVVGGVVGSMMSNRKHNGSSGSSDGDSAKDDQAKNGDLGINSSEIKKLLNNPNLHKVFPGMDYTPLNTQYPACLSNPPSQNNITRDVAVLSQLTNKIRLYGTDCNQTQMLIHAIDRLELKDTKIWLGVWQDNNKTTNARQLEQMWDILDQYGQDPFEGVIVANEILFRQQMTETQLGSLLDDVRTNLTKMKIDLPVATSDLGDDWTSALAKDSDYIMANIHPFFAGVTAEKAAAWTYSFWENNNGPLWKSDKQKNVISETGWPTGGGTDCGGATTCTEGSVAGIDELNTFMEGWVCDALKNGTNYFWFEAFDEPWKIAFNTKGKEWEDKWGLLTVDRDLKKGVKIPDCGGQTVDD
ncbi:glycoside hydrolase superfamily [Mariannaea sp. PMI_226]|nr:glycoside hydrolase superfamily [Mariannaea sp. PMI_226]